MVKVVKLEVGSIVGALLKDILPKMSGLVNDMTKYCKSISPTDTGDYINSFKNKVVLSGTSIIGEILNDSKHASGVETGFRKSPVNWHKGPPRSPGTRIYTGVGANVQQRTVNQFIKEIPERLGSKSSK